MWQIFGQQNTIFVPENYHHALFSWSCSTKLSCCFFTCLLPGLDSLLTEEIAIVCLNLTADCDAIKTVVRIYFALLQKPLTTVHTISTLNRYEQFWYPSCRNLRTQMIIHNLINCCCCNCQFISYAMNRDLSITHSDPFYGFNVFISGDGGRMARSR